MVKLADVINFMKSEVNKPHDFDGYYGSQCVDLVNFYLYHFWKMSLSGNAIDLLNSAKAKGMEVIYDAPGVNPKAGDIVVMKVSSHPYGHTGIVLEDSDGYTIKTLEQNIDGNADALTKGAPARFNTRNFDGVIGWIRPKFEGGNDMTYSEDMSLIRWDTPQVGVAPYRQVHMHSTGNPNSTAQGEASYMKRKDLNTGFYTHVVGNGKVYQTAPVGQGCFDVGGSWNAETFAAYEIIESHKTYDTFIKDYWLWITAGREGAKQGNIPLTLDSDELAGVKTHYYCTYHQPNNASDHVDPYHYLAKWGITKEQFKKDFETGAPSGTVYKPTTVNVFDTNTNLENRDRPYYKAVLKQDYYLETEPNVNSKDKELLKKGTEVYVYEKKNGWSRVNSPKADQWLEDDYLVEAVEM